MSAEHITVIVPRAVAVPRGAAWAAAAVGWLLGGDPARPTGPAAWLAFARHGRLRRRAARRAVLPVYADRA